MNKKKYKISRAISAIVLCVTMLAVSICGANAAEATADDNNDNNTAVEETTTESNENESNSTDYNWSSNTTGNANLTADQEILMEMVCINLSLSKREMKILSMSSLTKRRMKIMCIFSMKLIQQILKNS